jgi:hypothetical protein
VPLPSVLRPVDTSGGADRYEVTQRGADLEILPGVRTPTRTYDGTFPGPTIESRRGRHVTVTHRNELPVPTVVHLHGGRTRPESDGYPTDLVLPARWPDGGHTMRGTHGLGGMPSTASMHGPGAVTSQLTREYTYPFGAASHDALVPQHHGRASLHTRLASGKRAVRGTGFLPQAVPLSHRECPAFRA